MIFMGRSVGNMAVYHHVRSLLSRGGHLQPGGASWDLCAEQTSSREAEAAVAAPDRGRAVPTQLKMLNLKPRVAFFQC